MKKLLIIIYLLIGAGCLTETWFEGPDFYADDFEAYATSDDLITEDDSLWSFSQLTRAGNTITIDTLHRYTGQQALRFSARAATEEELSKCSLVKQFMAFWEGETVRMQAWYYIEGDAPLQWLFLMDIEEQAAIGAGPGMRLALVDNALRVEYKFLEDDMTQPAGAELPFPRDQWVELVWEIKLSQRNEGRVRLWQDGQLIISSQNNTTLPTDILYAQQGTKGMYSSFEIGITANPTESELTIWVDDVKIERLE